MSEMVWYAFKLWLCRRFGHRGRIDYASLGGGDPEICRRCGQLLSTNYSRSKR